MITVEFKIAIIDIDVIKKEKKTFVEAFFLAGCSIKKKVNIDKPIVRKIKSSFPKLLSYKISKFFANEKIVKCHKYKEYEINPMPTKILEDKILVISSPLSENHKIRATPETGINV